MLRSRGGRERPRVLAGFGGYRRRQRPAQPSTPKSLQRPGSCARCWESTRPMTRLLLVDNYDSFTWNLAHLFGGVDGVEVDVIRNDDPRLGDGVTARYDGVIVGPGPGRPADAGRTHCDRARSGARRGGRCSACAWDCRRSARPSAGASFTRPARCTERRRRSRTTAAASSPGCLRRSRRRAIIRWSSTTTAFPRSCARMRPATTA